MRDLIIAAGILLGYWLVPRAVHTGRTATVRFLDFTSRCLSTLRFHVRLFCVGTEPSVDPLQLVMRASRWTIALGCRVYHIYMWATGSSNTASSHPDRAQLSHISDFYRLCVRIFRETSVLSKVETRSRNLVVRKAQLMPWMLACFAVSLSYGLLVSH